VNGSTCNFDGELSYPVEATGFVWFNYCDNHGPKPALARRGHKKHECGNFHYPVSLTELLSLKERSLDGHTSAHFKTQLHSVARIVCPVKGNATEDIDGLMSNYPVNITLKTPGSKPLMNGEMPDLDITAVPTDGVALRHDVAANEGGPKGSVKL
jgi:hypothetical protein